MLLEKQLIFILDQFQNNTGVECTIIFDKDGLTIASNIGSNYQIDCNESLSALASGIISLAENGIQAAYGSNYIKDITVETIGQKNTDDEFNIIIERINDEMMICVISPISINKALILLELRKTIKELENYFIESLDNLYSSTNSEQNSEVYV